METVQEVAEETHPSDAELEETHVDVERELNLLFEMTLRMEHELNLVLASSEE